MDYATYHLLGEPETTIELNGWLASPFFGGGVNEKQKYVETVSFREVEPPAWIK